MAQVISQLGAFAPELGIFCDASAPVGAPARFQQLTCWDLNPATAATADEARDDAHDDGRRGAPGMAVGRQASDEVQPIERGGRNGSRTLRVVANVSDAVQLIDGAFDLRTKAVVGLGLCCTAPGCPSACAGLKQGSGEEQACGIARLVVACPGAGMVASEPAAGSRERTRRGAEGPRRERAALPPRANAVARCADPQPPAQSS